MTIKFVCSFLLRRHLAVEFKFLSCLKASHTFIKSIVSTVIVPPKCTFTEIEANERKIFHNKLDVESVWSRKSRKNVFGDAFKKLFFC